MAMLYVLVFPAAILDADGGIRRCSPLGLAGLNNAGPARPVRDPLRVLVDGRRTTAARSPASRARRTTTTRCSGSTRSSAASRMIVPMLALAGFLAEKKVAPESAGTFPVTTPLFVVLLVGVVLIVSALTFFPALSLGPIVEHLLMGAGQLF